MILWNTKWLLFKIIFSLISINFWKNNIKKIISWIFHYLSSKKKYFKWYLKMIFKNNIFEYVSYFLLNTNAKT
jgi:hypothetical protein